MEMNDFSSEEIIEIINNENDKLAKKKLQAFLLYKEGNDILNIASKLSKHISSIYNWINQIKREGLKNLQMKKGRGLKPKLSKENLAQLKLDLEIPIKTDDGYSRGWQSKDVYHHILKKYKVNYSLRRIQELLNLIGFRKITCRPRSKRRNEELTQEFLNSTKKNEIYWVKNIN